MTLYITFSLTEKVSTCRFIANYRRVVTMQFCAQSNFPKINQIIIYNFSNKLIEKVKNWGKKKTCVTFSSYTYS